MSASTSGEPQGKVALRAHYRALRRALSPEARSRYSALIAEALYADQRVQEAEVIACYDAFDGEADLSALYEALRARLRPPKLVFPVHHRGQSLRFYEARSWRAEGSSYRRPVGPEVALSEIALVLSPGVAFSDQGLRLGFGGGFYDRSFPTLSVASRASSAQGPHSPLRSSGAICFGVAFSLQVTSTLPSDPWDLQVDVIATERGLRYPSP